MDCVGGASATYARICLIAFYFKLFLSHLFNHTIISRITVCYFGNTATPFKSFFRPIKKPINVGVQRGVANGVANMMTVTVTNFEGFIRQ